QSLSSLGPANSRQHKVAAPDLVHIPIIQIEVESPQIVDKIVTSLAKGEIFIPHMSIMPEAIGVNGVSPPDLVVRFGCERNEDSPPDDWPNWCLEFVHNQLYDHFRSIGARWSKRPFQITLAKKVRWKTVKHMNKYFAQSEKVINAWREKGPQYLEPELSYIAGGATPAELARPHGIYLLRNGRPTNYFAPNFEPPYNTKIPRSLLMNVTGTSWDKVRRDWASEPNIRLTAANKLIGAVMACNDPTFCAEKGEQAHVNCNDLRNSAVINNFVPQQAATSPSSKHRDATAAQEQFVQGEDEDNYASSSLHTSQSVDQISIHSKRILSTSSSGECRNDVSS
ncbi:MAG: hypothetical protein ACRDL7_08850, partial [Gaiellaceae bacterium]